MQIDLSGNIKVIGSVFMTVIPARGWWITSRSFANETAEPWRHGRGVAVRIGTKRALSVGRWWPTSDEQPGYLPQEEPVWDEPTAEEIKQWVTLQPLEVR